MFSRLNPRIRKRYVDDTFIVTTGATVNELLFHMNSQQKKSSNRLSLSNHYSAFAAVHSDVHQGSVFGPILFTIYIMSLSAIIDSHSIMHHSLVMTYNYRCLLPLTSYPSYLALCSHVYVISRLGHLRTC